MNIHVPQNMEAAYELTSLAAVPTQIISPASGKPIIGAKQDSLLGCYILTRDGMRLKRRHFMNYLMPIKNFTGIMPEPSENKDAGINSLYTGQQVYSSVLPRLSYNRELKVGNQDTKVVIRNGELVSGILTKDIVGAGSSLIKNIYNILGIKPCSDYLNDSQQLIMRFLADYGYSIGIGDGIPHQEILDKVRDDTYKALQESHALIQKVHGGVFKPELGNELIQKSFEAEITTILNSATDSIGKFVLGNMCRDNRFHIAITSKSKGNSTNIAQIMGIVGQTMVEGERVPMGYTHRTVPHYHKFDQGAMARGFVIHSFMEGLSPIEYFFHAMGGRIGLIDTAVKTARSGYIQRKLVKSTEDGRVHYDGTVRNPANTIIQFAYGDDCIDARKLERSKLITVPMDNRQLENRYKFDNKFMWKSVLKKKAINEMKKTENWQEILDEEYTRIREDRDKTRRINEPYLTMMEDIGIDTPIDPKTLRDSAINEFHIAADELSDLNPIYVSQQIEKLISELKMHNHDVTFYTKVIIRSFFATKRIICEYHLNKLAFDFLVERIRNVFNSALVHPGEMVGPLAAQSIGEPSTQMTLNSLHKDENVPVFVDGKLKVQSIGSFIDSNMDLMKDKCQSMENDTTYLDCKDKDYKIWSTDEIGNVTIKKIEAMTRHPVVNEDGSSTLVKVTTKTGRSVIATKAKSFLVYDEKEQKIMPTRGDEVKIGDRVPITLYYNEFNQLDSLSKSYKIPNDTELSNNKFIDVYLDSITKIEEVDYEHPYVYDFTVEDTRNFVIANGLHVRDTFHLAGVGGKSIVTTKGVPRIEEILSVTQKIKTPSMTIRLKPEYAQNESIAQKVKTDIIYTTIGDLMVKSDFLSESKTVMTSFQEDVEFINTYLEFNKLLKVTDTQSNTHKSPWVIRMEFSKEELLNRNVQLIDIQNSILREVGTEGEIECIFNDDNARNLIIRIKLRQDDLDDNSHVDAIRELERQITMMTFRGIPGIVSADVRKEKRIIYLDDGSYQTIEEYVIDTDGTNLLEILKNEYVDSRRTKSNDIVEIYKLFGIEAGRNAIINEMNEILAEYGTESRHISLLADYMTYKGVIASINQHGVPGKLSDSGPLAKASFEKTTQQLVDASVFGEVDRIKGSSANIMFAQLPPGGTNAFDLMFDEKGFVKNLSELRAKAEYTPVRTEEDPNELEKEIADLHTGDGDFYNDDDLDFSVGFDINQQYKIGLNIKTPKVKVNII